MSLRLSKFESSLVWCALALGVSYNCAFSNPCHENFRELNGAKSTIEKTRQTTVPRGEEHEISTSTKDIPPRNTNDQADIRRRRFGNTPTGRNETIIAETNKRVPNFSLLERAKREPAFAAKIMAEFKRLDSQGKNTDHTDWAKILDANKTSNELEKGRSLVGPVLISHAHDILIKALEAQNASKKPTRIFFPLPEGALTWQIAMQLLKNGEAMGESNPYKGLSANKNFYLFPSMDTVAEVLVQLREAQERKDTSNERTFSQAYVTLRNQMAAIFTQGKGGRDKVNFSTDQFLMASMGYGADSSVIVKEKKYSFNPAELMTDLVKEMSAEGPADRFLGLHMALYAGEEGAKKYVRSAFVTAKDGYEQDASPQEGRTTPTSRKFLQAVQGNRKIGELLTAAIEKQSGRWVMKNSQSETIDEKTLNKLMDFGTADLDASKNDIPFAQGIMDATRSADPAKLETLRKSEDELQDIRARLFEFIRLEIDEL